MNFATRLIVGKTPIEQEKTKLISELRLLLEYAAKIFFIGSVDVRGIQFHRKLSKFVKKQKSLGRGKYPLFAP